MARRCELTGKGPMSGNNVSHAMNRTKRRFLPNLCNVTLHSDVLSRSVKAKISAHALRSIDHVGGLDAFLKKASAEDLSLSMKRLRREIIKADAENAASA